MLFILVGQQQKYTVVVIVTQALVDMLDTREAL